MDNQSQVLIPSSCDGPRRFSLLLTSRVKCVACVLTARSVRLPPLLAPRSSRRPSAIASIAAPGVSHIERPSKSHPSRSRRLQVRRALPIAFGLVPAPEGKEPAGVSVVKNRFSLVVTRGRRHLGQDASDASVVEDEGFGRRPADGRDRRAVQGPPRDAGVRAAAHAR